MRWAWSSIRQRHVCIIGELNEQKNHLLRDNVQAIDYGLDFYAPRPWKPMTAAG